MSAINDMEAAYAEQILNTWTCPYCFRKLDDIPIDEGISPKDHIWYEENVNDGVPRKLDLLDRFFLWLVNRLVPEVKR